MMTGKENLILRRVTHLDQLADKLQEPRVRRVVESGIRKTQVYAFFTIKGKDLGLTGDRANADIDVRIGLQAHAGEPTSGRKR